jgi:diguanylate cyclase (GGDEF)-like protein
MTTEKLSHSISKEAFTTFLVNEVKRTARYNRSLITAYINIDGLDEVGKKYGPGSAERVLQAIAETIKKNLRESDATSLLSQNEFGILLPETNQNQAQTIVLKVQQELTEAMAKNQWDVTFRIGVVISMGKNTFEEIYKKIGLLRDETMFTGPDVIGNQAVVKKFEDIKLIGIDEEMTQKVFLTPNKYNAHLKLSDYPPLKWEELFDEERKSSPHSLWHHAWIQGRNLVVQCALEEITQKQLNIIKQNVDDTNKKHREFLKQEELKQIKTKNLDEEEKKKKHKILSSLVFE